MAASLTIGTSLKPQHYEDAYQVKAQGLWFEVHPENYFVDGGPRLAWLQAIRERHPIALHGVGQSFASMAAPDASYLARLARLVEFIEPAIVSEHLAWSSFDGNYYPDLFPFPRTNAALTRLAANISQTQDRLGRAICIENPTHYVTIDGHEWSEVDFLVALANRTGCKLLVDVNNVFISANNLGYSADAWIDAIPADLVMEIHLAGHTPDPVLGNRLLVDTHDAPIAGDVWRLFDRLVKRIGPRPTLIERDGNIPIFSELLAERLEAIAVINRSGVAA